MENPNIAVIMEMVREWYVETLQTHPDLTWERWMYIGQEITRSLPIDGCSPKEMKEMMLKVLAKVGV